MPGQPTTLHHSGQTCGILRCFSTSYSYLTRSRIKFALFSRYADASRVCIFGSCVERRTMGPDVQIGMWPDSAGENELSRKCNNCAIETVRHTLRFDRTVHHACAHALPIKYVWRKHWHVRGGINSLAPQRHGMRRQTRVPTVSSLLHKLDLYAVPSAHECALAR